MILYEYPFNERIRTYLRLEHLFRRLGELVPRDHPIDHHYSIATIFEVMDVAARTELKGEVMKDLDRQRNSLAGYRGNPNVSEAVLDEAIGKLDRSFNTLNTIAGKAGQQLADNEWLMSIRSRINIPGGTCEFDLPAYYAWQQRPADQRRADLERWASTLGPLAEAVHMLLKLLRESGVPQKAIANGGQYQQNLPQGRSFQLLRLRVNESMGLVPEISGNRLMASVRFMRQEVSDRLQPANEDVAFELTLCS
ncbi:MAG TPA: cell division protein ZapD [Ramlibacter sp.]|nr:cell division protein ZapD [Ramlibacter sp.]